MKKNRDRPWTHGGSKFVIGTLHGELVEIEAQYNPKELARTSSATWKVHPNTSAKHSRIGENHKWMEYGTTEPRTLTVELTFDGYEEGVPVTPVIEKLENLTVPVDMVSSRASERRPQLCVAVWGTQKLRCVVESVATKLTMFAPSGEPLRAICTVVLKEVDAVAMMNADGDRSNIELRDRRIASDANRLRPNPPGAKIDFNDLE